MFDWEKVDFQYLSDFVPVQSQSYGSITLGRIMEMSFDFVFGGRTNDPYTDDVENFFRIGYNSNTGNTGSCQGQNSRFVLLLQCTARHEALVLCWYTQTSVALALF